MRVAHRLARLCLVACALALFLSTLGEARAEEIPRRPEGSWVFDRTSTLDTYTTGEISELSAALWREHHARLAVVLVPDVAPYSLEDFAGRTFRAWGLDRDTRERGVLLLVAVSVRRNRIEVSTGLGATFSAYTAEEILTKVFRPTARAEGARAGALATSRAIVEQFREGRYDTRGPVARVAGFLVFALLLLGLLAWLSKVAVLLLLNDADEDLQHRVWTPVAGLCALYALPMMSAFWLHVPSLRNPAFEHPWRTLAGLYVGLVALAVSALRAQRFVLHRRLDGVGVEALSDAAETALESGAIDALPFSAERLEDLQKRCKLQRYRVVGYRWPVDWIVEQLREECAALRRSLDAARSASPEKIAREVAALRDEFARLTKDYTALVGSPPLEVVNAERGAPFREGAQLVDALSTRFAEVDLDIASKRYGAAVKRAREITEKRRAELSARRSLEAQIDRELERRDEAVQSVDACVDDLPRVSMLWDVLRNTSPRPVWVDLSSDFAALPAQLAELQRRARVLRDSLRPCDDEALEAFKAELFSVESSAYAARTLLDAVKVRREVAQRARETIAELEPRVTPSTLLDAVLKAETVKAVSTQRELCRRLIDELQTQSRTREAYYSLVRHAAALTAANEAVTGLLRALPAGIEADRRAAEAAMERGSYDASGGYGSSGASSYASSDCAPTSSDCSSSDCSSSTGSSSDW